MVGPGEVDDELESETADECSKYGKVIKCLIFEVSATFSAWILNLSLYRFVYHTYFSHEMYCHGEPVE